MTVQIQNAAEIEAPWTAWFFYGDSGSGKTHSVSTFPKPLVIVPKNEGSILTLRGLSIDFAEVGNRADMLGLLHQLETRYRRMCAMPLDAPQDELDAAFPYHTIAVESLSHYCELLIEDLSQRGSLKMDYGKWGELGSHIRSIHSRLRSMDVHIVYTSLAKVDDNGRGQPMMVGKTAMMTPSACDYLGYCEAIPGRVAGAPPNYRVHFAQFGPWPARARQSPALRQRGVEAFPAVIDNFSFDSVRPYLGF